jgi:hypothetical protein
MANRTVQILGQGYGANPAQITVTANGNTVFSGTVSAVDQPLPALPNLDINLSEILCTFEIDQAFTGQIPMTCAVSSGTVIFAQIYANYVAILNPVYTPEQITILTSPTTTQAERVTIYTQVANPPLSQTDIDTLLDPAATQEQKNAIIAAHNCTTEISSGVDGFGSIDNTDARSSVAINGIAQTPDHGELPGTWWWAINAGSTLSYQLDVDPATV